MYYVGKKRSNCDVEAFVNPWQDYAFSRVSQSAASQRKIIDSAGIGGKRSRQPLKSVRTKARINGVLQVIVSRSTYAAGLWNARLFRGVKG